MLKKIVWSVFVVSFFLNCNTPIPKGITGHLATKLHVKALKAAQLKEWAKIKYFTFEFHALNTTRKYVWDRSKNFIQVEWNNNLVQYNKKNLQGIAFKTKNNIVKPIHNLKKKKNLLKKAYELFTNDFFWFNPILHINHKDLKISYIEPKSLLVNYPTGGVTPGDTYLFEFDENYLIKNMQLWVSIIPIKGIKIKFKDYLHINNTFKIAQLRTKGLFKIQINNVNMLQKVPQNNFIDLEKFLKIN